MAAGWGRPPAATALLLLLSLVASAPGLLRGAPAARSAASLRAAAVRAGEVHRLITYIFVYEDLISLTCGAIIIWYFAGSFEKNVGTVKHCVLTVAFAVLSALLYLLLETVVSRVSEVEDAKGFMPVAFATLGVSTTRSRMKRTLFFGVRVPVVLVPWFMLCIAWFIPHSSLLSNLCGLLAGEAYGLGYCFCLDFPESVGSKLDRVFPFSLRKRISGLKYIPGSLAERSAFENSNHQLTVKRPLKWKHSHVFASALIHVCISLMLLLITIVCSVSVSKPAFFRINPAPGSYPTQSYSCSSPPALPTFQMQQLSAQSQGLHPSCALGHEGSQQGYTAGHSLPSSLYEARGAFGEHFVQVHIGASPGQCCQPGKFSLPQRVCVTDPQIPTGTGPPAGVHPAAGCPAATVAPVSVGFSRVQMY